MASPDLMAMADWELVVRDPRTVAADLDQQGDAVRATIRGPGGRDVRAVLLRAHGAGELVRGRIYVLTLDVSAAPARTVEVAIREAGGAARARLRATPRWSARTVHFRLPPGPPASSFALEFALGAASGVFEFDGLSLRLSHL